MCPVFVCVMMLHSSCFESISLSMWQLCHSPFPCIGLAHAMPVTHCCPADSNTQTPTFAFPAASTTISSNFSLDFTLPEAAASGTVKLTLTRSAGTADSGSPHIITFASAFETAAQHTMTVPPLSGAATSGYEIASISSNGGNATDLVDGATYTARLQYQDALSNPPARVDHSTTFGEADSMGGLGSTLVLWDT